MQHLVQQLRKLLLNKEQLPCMPSMQIQKWVILLICSDRQALNLQMRLQLQYIPNPFQMHKALESMGVELEYLQECTLMFFAFQLEQEALGPLLRNIHLSFSLQDTKSEMESIQIQEIQSRNPECP